jgi:hypothetical protein
MAPASLGSSPLTKYNGGEEITLPRIFHTISELSIYP